MIKVLVAEDDKTSQTVLKKMVERLGYEVHIEEDGQKALSELENNEYHILVTDYMMPNMDGRELVNNVKKIKKYEKLPIIMVSAFVTINEIADLLDNGITYFLPKHVNVDEFEDYLQRCVRKVIKEYHIDT